MFKQKIILVILMNLLTAYSNDLIAVEDSSEASVADDSGDVIVESTDEVFIPTAEWQEVKPGQAIPKGLHVRINMETGKKEARLLATQEEERKESPLDRIDHEELKEALKKIKNDIKAEEAVQAKFRSMDELKEHMKDLEVKVETDVEVMRKLVDTFNNTEDIEEKVDTLETLEYYVHQFDNAIDFLTLQGVEKILVPSLNSTREELQEKVGFLIGSAAQSNPKVQIRFLESGLVTSLLRLISGHNSPAVAGKALYGLSAVLRNFPEAQNTFLRQGGLDVLKAVFKVQGKPMDNIKIKILTLIQDLLEERRNLDISSQTGRSRREQYSKMDLEDLLYSSGWCDVFSLVLVMPRDDRRAKRDDLLTTVSDEFPVRVEHDTIEKIINAMLGMRELCATEYRTNTELTLKLQELSRQYAELSAREQSLEEEDNYFSSLLHTINLVLSSSNIKTEL